MLGAIIGDIAGSKYEFNNIKTKNFEIMTNDCFFTDDSVMTLAIAKAFLNCKNNFSNLEKETIKYMKHFGLLFPTSYGYSFNLWLRGEINGPYNSYGNGAAMRVSSCAYVGKTIEEVKALSKIVTSVTHNHIEGIKGAEATAVAIFLARIGKNKEEIKDYIAKNYYKLDFTLDKIRDTYIFNETCQDTVPQAIEAFLESNDFEDSIKNAISIGGDSDTLAAITGSIAESYYGIPNNLRDKALSFLPGALKEIFIEFEEKYKINK